MKQTVNSWIIRDEYKDKKGILNHDCTRFHVFVCSTCKRVYEQNPMCLLQTG